MNYKEDSQSDYAEFNKVIGIKTDISCPFCDERGFDLVGLKGHLSYGDCEVYNNTETPSRLL